MRAVARDAVISVGTLSQPLPPCFGQGRRESFDDSERQQKFGGVECWKAGADNLRGMMDVRSMCSSRSGVYRRSRMCGAAARSSSMYCV